MTTKIIATLLTAAILLTATVASAPVFAQGDEVILHQQGRAAASMPNSTAPIDVMVSYVMDKQASLCYKQTSRLLNAATPRPDGKIILLPVVERIKSAVDCNSIPKTKI